MEQITGRIVADAQVNTTKDGRTVTNFSVALNDSYQPKGSGERRQFTTYVNCSFWRTDKLAAHLKKGLLVKVFGRLGINVYNNSNGEARGSMNCFVQDINFLGAPSKSAPTQAAANSDEQRDDLPF
ncbi:MAG: single-stranded DNA-binding protein [Flavisolibacter sp.]|nr:single-stranded DNA-binding protein [Flavisolibacter sp.]